MWEHKDKKTPGFTAKYNINKLIYYEIFSNPEDAITAEKKIKGWTRAKKLRLVQEMNPTLTDLTRDSSLCSE